MEVYIFFFTALSVEHEKIFLFLIPFEDQQHYEVIHKCQNLQTEAN
jgi:hypothetical protein